jgi:hypothetical protein
MKTKKFDSFTSWKKLDQVWRNYVLENTITLDGFVELVNSAYGYQMFITTQKTDLYWVEIIYKNRLDRNWLWENCDEIYDILYMPKHWN